MELQYEKAMKQNGLSYSELPEDAQTGIDQIKNVLKGFNMSEKKGNKPTSSSLKKLKAMDKWVYYEILDYLHDTDKNDDDIPFDADDVIDDLDKGKNNDNDDSNDSGEQADPIGLEIESELEVLFASGKKDYTIDELSSKARKTYGILWDSYEDNEENGIVTTKFSLVENASDKKFYLKQN